jgi:DNA-binding CsgD family transcriptional regulator
MQLTSENASPSAVGLVSEQRSGNPGLPAALLALAPFVLGLALAQVARATITHTDFTNPHLDWLSDLGAFASLACLALPLLLVFALRLRLAPVASFALGYSAVALAAFALLADWLMHLLGLQNDVILLAVIVASYLAEAAGTYFWLQAARSASPAQAIILVFAAVMAADAVNHAVLGLLGAFSYQLALLLMVASLACLAAYRRRRPSICVPTRDSSAPRQSHGIFGLATAHMPIGQVLALSCTGVAMLTFAVGLLLGFVPKAYAGTEHAGSPSVILAVLALRCLLVQGACIFFIVRAWQGRLWQLSVGILQVIALLAFAVLPASLLHGLSPLNLDTLIANSLYVLLVGFMWYLVIFFSNNASGLLREPLACFLAGLFCCLLPRALGRSVFYPLISSGSDPELFAVMLSSIAAVALAAFCWLYLRAAISGHLACARQSTLAAALAPGDDREMPMEDHSRLRIASMRKSVERLGQTFRLSQREVEVLTLYALGHTQKSVAAELFISPETVHSHIKNIYIKTNMGSRQKILDYLSSDV